MTPQFMILQGTLLVIFAFLAGIALGEARVMALSFEDLVEKWKMYRR
jgi:hypothetical protein